MKHLLKLLIRNLPWLCLIVSFSASSQVILDEEGEIYQVNNSSININDTSFRISPTVKVFISPKKKGYLSSLKRGDYVRILVEKINKVEYVDTIFILDGPQTDEPKRKKAKK